MKQSFKFFLFLILKLSLSYSLEAQTCKSVLAEQPFYQELDALFNRAYYDNRIHRDGFCAANTIVLYRYFKASFDEKIKESDFKIHHIARPEWFSGLQDDVYFVSPLARSSKGEEFLYHVILEYKGRVYDLDLFTKPSPMGLSSYVQDILISRSSLLEDPNRERVIGGYLEILTIPGEDILSFANPGDAGCAGFLEEAYALYPRRNLNEFVKERGL